MLLEFHNSVIQGDCRKVLSELSANFVQLTITSPPYRNAIDYEAHVEKNGYYRGKTKKETGEYLEEMVQIFNEQIEMKYFPQSTKNLLKRSQIPFGILRLFLQDISNIPVHFQKRFHIVL